MSWKKTIVIFVVTRWAELVRILCSWIKQKGISHPSFSLIFLNIESVGRWKTRHFMDVAKRKRKTETLGEFLGIISGGDEDCNCINTNGKIF